MLPRHILDMGGGLEMETIAPKIHTFGSLSLVIIEVGRNGDNSFLDFLAELCLCDFLHLVSSVK